MRLLPHREPAVWLNTLRPDTGACKYVIDGSIKLKSGPPAKPLQGGSSVKLTHFTRDAAVFDDGTEVKADVVIFATG